MNFRNLKVQINNKKANERTNELEEEKNGVIFRVPNVEYGFGLARVAFEIRVNEKL